MEDRAVKLALAQLEIEPARPAANREAAVEAVAAAAGEGADLVALPEMFTVGYFAFDAYQRAAEPLEGPTVEAMREAAREHGVAVLAGTFVEDLAETARTTDAAVPAEDGLANTAVLLDADGERRLVYRKHHLFGYDSAEAELLVPGERVETATIGESGSDGGSDEAASDADGDESAHDADTTGDDAISVGVTTCYDLRFPELYRDLVDAGAELVLVPSAWPYPRVEHWELLPRARAVENLLYVGAVNGAATDDEESLVGRSAVYDPWGTQLAGSGEDATIVYAALDPERVASVREEFPALRDRRH